jgi:hypothetical protein
MAAGLGFKTFTTGEVLTAADVNGYLMQGVLVFATEAARNSAITSPQEGQFAFTKDTNSLWYYTGSAWAASGATGDIEGVTAGTGISGGGTSGTVTITNSMATAIDAKGDLIVGTGADTFSRLAVGTNGQVLTADSSEATGLKFATPAAGGGKVLQVVSMSKTSVFSSTATTYTDITGYSLSITPSAATSKILVLFSPSLFVGDVSTQLYQGFRILRDATTIMTNDRANVQGAAALGGGYTWQYIQASFIYLDSPSTTSSVTYKAQTKDDTGIPHGINIGSTGNSTITLMEIGA